MIDLQSLLRSYDPVQISFHEVTNKKNITNNPTFSWYVDNVLQTENVLVHAVFHDNDFSKDSFCIYLNEGKL